MDKKTTRSFKYQSFFAELPYSNEMMAEFSEAQGLVENYTPEDREGLMDLREELRIEFWRLVDEQLTPRQGQVLKLLAKGYTQIEIAKQLNVNQSSITKSVNGNCDYRNGRRSYGGTRKKLCKIISQDARTQAVLAKMADIHAKY
jgi:DNA-binding CsgD family transcriptional regulator